jgi:hypothetical protein
MSLMDTIKKNRDVIIIGIIVILILAISIMSLSREEEEPLSKFESPFSSDQSFGEGWGSIDLTTTIGGSERSSLPVYSAQPYDIEDVYDIVVSLGMGDENPQHSENEPYYSWSRGEEFVRYNEDTGDLVVNAEAIPLDEDMDVSFSSQNAEQYFRAFVETYLDSKVDTSTSVQTNGSFFDATGVWQLGGYPVVLKNGQDYSVLASFDRNGNLVSLYASLIRFRQENSSANIIDLDELRSYVLLDTYPKEAYADIIVSGAECAEDCDPYGWDSIDNVEGVVIQEADIVYFYSQKAGSSVLPVYRLTGEGMSTEDSTTQRVSIVIYANAVDPAQIITSGEE